MKLNNEAIDHSLYIEVIYFGGKISCMPCKREIKTLYCHEIIQEFGSLERLEKNLLILRAVEKVKIEG